ncbi:MAG TPA: type 2 lanthipeptide synthetase LanM family protein [Vicinamibacteria bacterium]|nr:type 2 lanthipeptide synthetase LanM family protein [Vicinamibacteria bacterium]
MRPALRAAPATSERDRLEIARGAATLLESLGGTEGAVPTVEQGREVLQRWAEAFSRGDAPAFERRLRWDGLDADGVLRALVRPAQPTGALPPAWTAWLDRFLEQSSALVASLGTPELEAELERLTPSPAPPFIEVWAAMVRSARRALADAGGTFEGIQEAAYATLESSLVAELSAAGEMALFQAFRGRGEPSGAGACDADYAGFVHGLLGGGLVDVFKAYPVLARQCAVLASTWVEATLELLTRLRRDRDAIAAAFGALPLGEVCRIAPALSDRHDGGRRVAVLTFSSGLSVVYKPRDVGLESALQAFQAWLSSRGLHDLPGVPRVLEREGYGWAEFVEQEPFRDREQVAEYFRRAGTLLGILHVLRGTDAHRENVVATRRGPALVDAEMLLQPRDANEEADSRAEGPIDGAAHGVRRSCLSSGLVTLLEVDASGACDDVGGLMPPSSRPAGTGARSWRALRSDTLGFVLEASARPPARNLVILDGVVQRPERFATEIREGFARAYRFFLAERSCLLDPQGPLALFASRRSRILFRPSDQYGACLQLLAAPRYQARGLDRSIALEILNRVFLHEEERPRLWPLVADERRALEELDVPRYLLAVDERELAAASGERVSGHLARSGLDAVMDGVRGLSEEDLSLQLDVLGSALEAVEAPSSGEGPVSSREGEALWLRAAELLGDAILARGRRGGDHELAWSDCDSRGPHGRHDLYRGRAGIALFFAALAAVTRHARFAEAAASLRRPFESALDASSPASPLGWPSIGACGGLGSVVFAVATAGRLLEDSAWTELALRWAAGITPERIERDPHLDVVEGTAGALLALLSLDRDSAPWIEERTIRCARRLVDARLASAGFAHGAAGVVYALSRACERAADAALAADVRRARRAARGLPSPAGMTAWCHGAAGVGLALALTPEAFRDEELLEELRAAAHATAGAPPHRVDHLCCGNLGRGEALLAMGTRLGDPGLVASSQAIASRIAVRVCAAGSSGARTEGFEHRTFHPGFFRGLSGIGYQLLRMAAPSRLPSVLGFEAWVRKAS